MLQIACKQLSKQCLSKSENIQSIQILKHFNNPKQISWVGEIQYVKNAPSIQKRMNKHLL